MYVRSIDRHILTYKCDCMPVYSHVEYMYKYTIIHKYTHIKLDLQKTLYKCIYLYKGLKPKNNYNGYKKRFFSK